MKRGFVVIGIFIAAILLGCQNGSEEETYTVWTDISTASEFQQTFGTTLGDGMYTGVEFTNSQFAQIMQAAGSEAAEYKHNWTEDELKKYFVGRGFDSDTAGKTAAWLVTVNHGFVASRSGNIVHYILK